MLNYDYSAYRASPVKAIVWTISDDEPFISSDDFQINLFSLKINNQSFNIIDAKPTNMEDLTGMTSDSTTS